MKRGAFFGEMSLLSGRRRSGTVTTAGSATLLEVPRKAMLRLMASEPPVKRFLSETFIARAIRTNLLKDVEADFTLLKDVEADFTQELAHRAEIRSLKKDEVIFKEGDIGDALYLIRSGSVKVTNERLIHHFACAHVAPVSDFEKGGELVCPKCRMRRMIVASDFEYANGPYRCADCHRSHSFEKARLRSHAGKTP